MNRLQVWLSAALMVLLAVILGIWISKNPLKKNIFVPTHEYRLVPEDAILPRGLDIKIDMQTGERWAKLPQNANVKDDLVFVKEAEKEEEEKDARNEEKQANAQASKEPPAYSNTSNRWKGRFQSVAAAIDQALADLEFDVSREDAYELLEEEASALEVGAGILHSSKFVHLRKLLLDDSDALNVLAICLQNNPPAVFKAIELGILEKEIKDLLESTVNEQVLKRLILLLNSFLIHGDNHAPEAEVVAQFKTIGVLPKLIEAIARIKLVPTERQLIILLKISSFTNESLPAAITLHSEFPAALMKHCESYSSCKHCQ